MSSTDHLNESDLVYSLRQRIEDLEKVVGLSWAPPRALDLTKSEAAILGMILGGLAKSRSSMYMAMYGDRLDPPADTIITVFISKIRKKLAAFDIEVETTGHRGYRLSSPNADKLFALYEADEQQTSRPGEPPSQKSGDSHESQDENLPRLRQGNREDYKAVQRMSKGPVDSKARQRHLSPETEALS